MTSYSNVLFTGGNGLLANETKALLSEAFFPSHHEFDVCNFAQMEKFLANKDINLIIHAAAFTSPPKVDKDPLAAVETNIIGTANVTKLCMAHGIRLIYISTDYVFRGDSGQYKEDDSVFPVNRYAWSKLGGECAVRLYDNSLIVRTSFGPNIFPYEAAFVDQWTSRESVNAIAKKIVTLVNTNISGVIHIGGNRRTVFEYAKSLDSSKEIKELSINNVNFRVPVDTSLCCEKYNSLINKN